MTVALDGICTEMALEHMRINILAVTIKVIRGIYWGTMIKWDVQMQRRGKN